MSKFYIKGIEVSEGVRVIRVVTDIYGGKHLSIMTIERWHPEYNSYTYIDSWGERQMGRIEYVVNGKTKNVGDELFVFSLSRKRDLEKMVRQYESLAKI